MLLFSGCIKEDFSDCPVGIRVYVVCETTYGAKGIDPSKVDKMNLYIFDRETGLLTVTAEDDNPLISSDYRMEIKHLPAGSYRIIAWGGLHGDYLTAPAAFTIGQTSYDDALMVFNHTDTVAHAIGYLFYAGLDNAQVTLAREQRFYLPLQQNTNTIHLTTEGLTFNEGPYSLWIADNNGNYTFDNSFASDGDFNYTAVCTEDEQGRPCASLQVLKLASGRNVTIELRNDAQGTCLYSANLIALLDARGVDYDEQHHYDIHLKFNADLSVDVSIDDWQVEGGGILLL